MLDPNGIAKRLYDFGNDWADKNAAAEILEETKKTLLAQIMQEKVGEPVSARETYALAEERYREHLETMVTARKEANKAKVRYDAEKTRIELLRTKSANEREVNKYAT